MKKVFILFISLLGMNALAQDEKFQVILEKEGFQVLDVLVDLQSAAYPPQLYYFAEFKIVNKTNEPLVSADILKNVYTSVKIEYDKPYVLTPITNVFLYGELKFGSCF